MKISNDSIQFFSSSSGKEYSRDSESSFLSVEMVKRMKTLEQRIKSNNAMRTEEDEGKIKQAKDRLKKEHIKKSLDKLFGIFAHSKEYLKGISLQIEQSGNNQDRVAQFYTPDAFNAEVYKINDMSLAELVAYQKRQDSALYANPTSQIIELSLLASLKIEIEFLKFFNNDNKDQNSIPKLNKVDELALEAWAIKVCTNYNTLYAELNTRKVAVIKDISEDSPRLGTV